MGKQKKNSNYITEKTKQKRLENEKKKKYKKIKKYVIYAILTVAIVAALALGIWGIISLANDYDPHEGHNHESEESSSAEVADLTATHHATIKIKGYDEPVHIELYGNEAPITVANFVELANSGFYDNLTFHRIIDGSIAQGGDPQANGKGGSGTDIKGEFSANGVQNLVEHKRGTISMARANDPDSASSQFFITMRDIPGYDGQYAAFGLVTSGMEVIDDIGEKSNPTDNNGSIARDEQPVIESITIHAPH